MLYPRCRRRVHPDLLNAIRRSDFSKADLAREGGFVHPPHLFRALLRPLSPTELNLGRLQRVAELVGYQGPVLLR